jgi:hypothetical protein
MSRWRSTSSAAAAAAAMGESPAGRSAMAVTVNNIAPYKSAVPYPSAHHDRPSHLHIPAASVHITHASGQRHQQRNAQPHFDPVSKTVRLIHARPFPQKLKIVQDLEIPPGVF